MIKIYNKENCSGCGACYQKCSRKCITLCEDSEGFMYPEVNKAECIDCGLCEKVCPIINNSLKKEPKLIYAGYSLEDSIRFRSSSGGFFSQLAKIVLNKGGVVFGAQFTSDWQVRIKSVKTEEDLLTVCGSKYVQADSENSFNECLAYLKKGTEVLYSGTPCQIAGLKLFLKTDYTNLTTVACACHGVPSPKVWRMYINYISKGKRISEIKFRDKSTGWKHYNFSVKFQNGEVYKQKAVNNVYMRAFVSSLIERPSCKNCKFRYGQSGADFVLADYWGISSTEKINDDDKGCGLVFVYSVEKANWLTNSNNYIVNIERREVGRNGAFIEHMPQHKKRDFFFSNLDESNCIYLLEYCLKPTIKDYFRRLIVVLMSIIKKVQ